MKQRIIGFDVARALAIFGMVIVNFKIVMSEETGGHEWAVWFASIFEGRASALFVILAGVGVTFLTNKARQSADTATIVTTRLALLKRSLLLIVIGLAFMPIWDADILHYYGIYFLIAMLIFTLSDQKLLTLTAVFTLVFPILILFFDYDYGWDWEDVTYPDFWTLAGFARHTLFNGFHPIFPWAAFLVFGMWLGRQDLSNGQVRKQLFMYALLTWIATETLFYGISLMNIVDEASVLTVEPMPPMPQYLVAAGSLAVVLITMCLVISKRFADHIVIKWLSQTGQVSPTIYLAHVVFGMGFLEAIGKLEDQTTEFALLSALVFCVLSIVFSTLWLSYFKSGPLEFVFRRLANH